MVCTQQCALWYFFLFYGLLTSNFIVKLLLEYGAILDRSIVEKSHSNMLYFAQNHLVFVETLRFKSYDQTVSLAIAELYQIYLYNMTQVSALVRSILPQERTAKFELSFSVGSQETTQPLTEVYQLDSEKPVTLHIGFEV